MPLCLKARYLAHFCALSSLMTINEPLMSARIYCTCMPDVSTLLYEIRSQDYGEAVHASLNRDLDRMKSWTGKRKVIFQPSNCKAMCIPRKWNPTRRNLIFSFIKLAEKNDLEILGVALDWKLIRTKYVSNIAARVGQKLGAL